MLSLAFLISVRIYTHWKIMFLSSRQWRVVRRTEKFYDCKPLGCVFELHLFLWKADWFVNKANWASRMSMTQGSVESARWPQVAWSIFAACHCFPGPQHQAKCRDALKSPINTSTKIKWFKYLNYRHRGIASSTVFISTSLQTVAEGYRI